MADDNTALLSRKTLDDLVRSFSGVMPVGPKHIGSRPFEHSADIIVGIDIDDDSPDMGRIGWHMFRIRQLVSALRRTA